MTEEVSEPKIICPFCRVPHDAEYDELIRCWNCGVMFSIGPPFTIDLAAWREQAEAQRRLGEWVTVSAGKHGIHSEWREHCGDYGIPFAELFIDHGGES